MRLRTTEEKAADAKAKLSRKEMNARRKEAARKAGLPWYFDQGGGRGHHHEEHAVMTVEDHSTFIAEVAEPKVGNQIVELIGALMQARDALEKNTTVDCPEFRAWRRANRALNAITAPVAVLDKAEGGQ